MSSKEQILTAANQAREGMQARGRSGLGTIMWPQAGSGLHLKGTQDTVKLSIDPVRSLGQEHPLEREMAAHFSTLAWKIPWTEEPGSL